MPWKKPRRWPAARRLVGAQDQLAELAFLLRQRLFLLLAGQPTADVEIGLALVAAEVQHLEGAERLVGRLQLALHADQALARGVDAELAEVGGDPLAAELLGDGGGRAGAARRNRRQVAFVAAGFDDAFEQGFGLLCWIVDSFSVPSR